MAVAIRELAALIPFGDHGVPAWPAKKSSGALYHSRRRLGNRNLNNLDVRQNPSAGILWIDDLNQSRPVTPEQNSGTSPFPPVFPVLTVEEAPGPLPGGLGWGRA